MTIFGNRLFMAVIALIQLGLGSASLIILLSHPTDQRPTALTWATIIFSFFFAWAFFRYALETRQRRQG